LKNGIIILAAGASTRMGKPKLLLDWGGTSILGHLISQWRTLGAEQIALVMAAGDRAISAELDRLGFSRQNVIVNPAPQQGMFSSIQCATRWPGWNKDLTHWTIILGDQPHLSQELLRQFIDFAALHSESVCQPSFQGRPRHPVILPKTAFEKLPENQAANLKEFLHSLPIVKACCPMDNSALDLDLDHPADYEKAIRLFPPEL
jgi:molybdenum cofactor cytidylyltransferase